MELFPSSYVQTGCNEAISCLGENKIRPISSRSNAYLAFAIKSVINVSQVSSVFDTKSLNNVFLHSVFTTGALAFLNNPC